MEIQSATIGAIAGALAKAQAAFATPKKTKTNPHLKNKYADLGDILDAVRPALAENGIALTQPAMQIEGREFVVSQLAHGESGEWLRSYTPVFEGNQKGAQGYGSGHTYARRYGASGITGVVADDDDDGNAASGQGSRQSRAAPKADDKPDPAAFAGTVKMGIEAADTVEALNRFWAKQKNSLAKLEAASAQHHQSVQEAFTARMSILAQAPDDDGPSPEQIPADADLTEAPF